MLTSEELMKPRYKVVADYPHIEMDQHGVGDIISPYGMGFVHPEKVKEQYDSFPHLFKKLEWWEERNIDDMPEYLKSEYKMLEVVEVYKISGYETNTFGEFFAKTPDSETGKLFIRNADAMPATKEEYDSFKSKQP